MNEEERKGESMRPHTTLFLLTSIDGKISTGVDFSKDFDKDIPNMKYASVGLQHYYDVEATTTLWSINSGKVMRKMFDQKVVCESNIYDNTNPNTVSCEVNFVIFDNSHLNRSTILWLCKRAWPAKCVILSSTEHIASKLNKHNTKSKGWEQFENLEFYEYSSLNDAFEYLSNNFDCKDVTIQTGCTLNAEFIKKELIDSIDIVIAPFIVGNNATNMVGTLSIPTEFTITSMDNLGDSYVRLRYNRVN